jgi:DNA repair ATPase RecN
MADVKDTQAKVDALSGQLDQMQTRVTEDVQALKDKLSSMEIDQNVLDEINTGLDSISQRVQAIDPDPSNPAPTNPPQG